MNVELMNFVGGDASVVQAAQVSTLGERSKESIVNAGLINYLMRERHASPFEHSVFTFYVHAPIFVTREMLRHRTASINEESGRYKELKTKFYYPDERRPLKQVGKTGDYKFESGDEIRDVTDGLFHEAYAVLSNIYSDLLDRGVAKEVARMVLPVGVYSSMYFTVNARGLINFLSLRSADNAQWEIKEIARSMENHFATLMPITFNAWIDNGRGQL